MNMEIYFLKDILTKLFEQQNLLNIKINLVIKKKLHKIKKLILNK